MSKPKLIVNAQTMKEIALEAIRIFGPYTDRISVRADEFCVQIMAYSEEVDQFVLPQGAIDLRVWEQKIELLLDRGR
jgi:hypothetical protein